MAAAGFEALPFEGLSRLFNAKAASRITPIENVSKHRQFRPSVKLRSLEFLYNRSALPSSIARSIALTRRRFSDQLARYEPIFKSIVANKNIHDHTKYSILKIPFGELTLSRNNIDKPRAPVDIANVDLSNKTI